MYGMMVKSFRERFVTENEADNIMTDETYIYAYSLQSFIDEQDYSSIAENLRKESALSLILHIIVMRC